MRSVDCRASMRPASGVLQLLFVKLRELARGSVQGTTTLEASRLSDCHEKPKILSQPGINELKVLMSPEQACL